MKNSPVFYSFVTFFFLSITSSILAQNEDWEYNNLKIPNYEREPPHLNGAFIENLGQLGIFGQPGQQAKSVLYYSAQPDYFDFVLRDRLSFVSAHSADSVGLLYNVNRLDLLFYNDQTEEYSKLSPVPYYEGHAKHHFYNGLSAVGFENAREFNEIYFENLYPDVDMSLTHNKLGLKAFFHFQSGIDPATVKMEFDGLTSINFNGGNVNIGAYQSTYQFHQPRAYQIDASNNITFLVVSFDVDANGRVFFNIPNYDANEDIYICIKQGDDVVSPKDAGDNLEWSSYIGEAGATTLYSITNDIEGNVYYAGKANDVEFASSTGNFPLIPYSDGGDGFVFKFNEHMEPQWYTFIGGDNSTAANLPAIDIATSVAPHLTDGIVLSGISHSTNIPMIGSSYDTDNSPNNTDPNCSDCQDIFYARFNTNGLLQYSSYFGGDGPEEAMEVISNSGTVYIVGKRSSNTPTVTNPISGSYNSSTGTGLILKFITGDNLSWATAFNVERINCAATNENADLIIGGAVHSSNSMVCVTPSTNPDFNSHNGSQYDGFIARFSVNDELTHSAFYGGECQEQITDLATDKSTNKTYGVGMAFAITGLGCTNFGSSDLPIIGGGLPRASLGYADHFYFNISMPQTGVPIDFTLSGYFSGDGMEFEKFSDFGINWTKPCVTVLGDGAFAISGMTNSGTNGSGASIPFPTVNPAGFYQELTIDASSSNPRDAYIAVFDNNATLKYTTYFGHGRFSEGPSGLSYTNYNNINRLYFAGNTQTVNSQLPGPEQLYVEPYESQLVYNDYFNGDGPTNQSGTNEAAWGAFLTMDGLNIPSTASITEVEDEIELKVYPNPAKNELYINSSTRIKIISIYSIDSKLVLYKNTDSTTEKIDISTLPAGSYVIRLSGETFTKTIKILKL